MSSTYVINGVKYIVDAKYEPAERKTLADRLKKYIKSDFADFTKYMKGDKMTSEYVLTAGKE
ncbi:MAG: hypothetical protein IJ766_06490 [Clostridia bacterium]|nr:hypothetical protein [Clostridia bacterium]